MTIFDKAIAQVSHLPPKERNEFARFILAELEDERRWAKQFARSQNQLARLADEAIEEFHAGKTEPMDLRRR